MSYEQSPVELEEIDKIKAEIDKIRQSGKELTEIEMAYLIYFRFCQFYRPNERFYFGKDEGKNTIQYEKPTTEDRKATCYQENSTIVQAMKELGINAQLFKRTMQRHVDGAFITKENEMYFFDASSDLSRAKTGRLIRHFGMSVKEIEAKRNLRYVQLIEMYLDHNGIYGKDCECRISENQIREMNRSLGLDFKGITINDFRSSLAEIIDNPEKMEQNLQSVSMPEQIEEIIDIIAKHKIPNDTDKPISIMDGAEYYESLFKIFPEQYISIFDGYENDDTQKSRNPREIFILKKKDDFSLYEFSEKSQKLEKLGKDVIKNNNILDKYYYAGFKPLSQYERTLQGYLERLRIQEREQEK